MPVTPPEHIRNLESYSVTSQDVWKLEDTDHMLKLDWNESTILNELVRKKISTFVNQQGSINWYPDVEAFELTEKIAQFLDCSPFEVLIFGGSDVALETTARTFLTLGDNVILVHPTYDNFRVYAESCGAKIWKLNPCTSEFQFDTESFIEQADKISNPKLIYLINPNNPIGYLITVDDIMRILKKFPNSAVIVDEAYIEFSGLGNSVSSLINEYDNLFVYRSFSKAFGLAGLRLGYIVSASKNLAYIKKIRNGKNVSMFAQLAGQILLDNYQVIKKHIDRINKSRSWFIKEFRKEGGTAFNSEANFVLIKVPKPQEVLITLKRKDIYIRDRSYIENLENCLRVTIGYQQDMERVLKNFKQMSLNLWVG